VGAPSQDRQTLGAQVWKQATQGQFTQAQAEEAMNVVVKVLIIWVLISIPIGLLTGKFLRNWSVDGYPK
jgi:ABC-type phosphate transport system permease subunit